VGAGGTVLELTAMSVPAHHLQDVGDPILLAPEPVKRLMALLVGFTPRERERRSHGQQLAYGNGTFEKVRGFGVILRKEIQHTLVKTLDIAGVDGDPHQGGDHALGHGCDMMRILRSIAMEIPLGNDFPTVTDDHAIEIFPVRQDYGLDRSHRYLPVID